MLWQQFLLSTKFLAETFVFFYRKHFLINRQRFWRKLYISIPFSSQHKRRIKQEMTGRSLLYVRDYFVLGMRFLFVHLSMYLGLELTILVIKSQIHLARPLFLSIQKIGASLVVINFLSATLRPIYVTSENIRPTWGSNPRP